MTQTELINLIEDALGEFGDEDIDRRISREDIVKFLEKRKTAQPDNPNGSWGNWQPLLPGYAGLR